jgi:hypothetical protein
MCDGSRFALGHTLIQALADVRHSSRYHPLAQFASVALPRPWFTILVGRIEQDMTVFVPLNGRSATPAVPPFLHAPEDSSAQLARVTKAVLKARRIAVVCGRPYVLWNV